MTILYTYEDIKELKKYIKKERGENRKVISMAMYIHNEISYNFEEVSIDISNFILSINNNCMNPNFLENKIIEIFNINQDKKIIINKKYLNDAMSYLGYIFDDYDELFKSKSKIIKSIIYVYSDINEVYKIAKDNNIEILSSTQLDILNLDAINKKYIDITNIIWSIKNCNIAVNTIELYILYIINIMRKNSKIIINEELYYDLIKFFYSIFYKTEKLNNKTYLDNNKTIKSITKMNNGELESLIKYLNDNLIGHNKFKNNLKNKLKNFIILNKIGQKKIFSIFLFGQSGIGKTEVARVIASFLNKNSNYVKINFGNYSSLNALNSLIGSPRGFVGSETGELTIKLNKSNVGVILCDEFEKADNNIFNFFLELLEDGKFTDSQSNEFDLNGFIIIFTSNINNQNEYTKIIPNSLNTRFDMVYHFDFPTVSEKKEFIELLICKVINENLPKLKIDKLADDEINELREYDYNNTNSLREIKRLFEDKLTKILEKYI